MSVLSMQLAESIILRHVPAGTVIWRGHDPCCRLTMWVPNHGTILVAAETWTGVCDVALRMLDTINGRDR